MQQQPFANNQPQTAAGYYPGTTAAQSYVFATNKLQNTCDTVGLSA